MLAKLDAIGAIDLLADNLDLLLDRQVEVIQELEVRLALAGGNNGLSESKSAIAALSPVVADDSGVSPTLEGQIADELELGRSVGAKYL